MYQEINRLEVAPTVQISEKFEVFLEVYRRPDGRKWSGQDLHDATDGIVSRSYVTNLRKGRIENPGFQKLKAIAKAMNFPPELWFEEDVNTGNGAIFEPANKSRDLVEKINHLFEAITNRKTGESYTNAEVARLSLGELSEEEVEGIRTGRIENPSVSQVVALADIFGVQPSYFLNKGTKPPLLDEEVMRALHDETTSAILHKSIRLPDREREVILGIIRQFEGLHGESDDR